MIIALESLFGGGVDKIPLNCEFDFSGEEYGGVFPFTTPVVLSGEISNNAGVVTIEADVTVRLDATCDRCCEKISFNSDFRMSHGLVSALNDEENDDFILVENMRLDLRELTLEDIYLELPGKLLCKEDCKGVCFKCGANLNEEVCSCEKDVDPRFEALLAMLD